MDHPLLWLFKLLSLRCRRPVVWRTARPEPIVFLARGLRPDIVVLGKPIGDGFPLAAVVTTEASAGSFDNGMEFFSAFGGNPVACGACLDEDPVRIG